MPTLFSKHIDEIVPEDIEGLFREQYPETDLVEFKKELPSKKGQEDQNKGSGIISDYARDKLLKEIVAFANAYGGHLIVGIDETDDNPHRAKSISPIPKCADLAEKFKLQIRDCIEPTLSLVGVRGITMDQDGSGVIIFRIPQSRAAPHRVKTLKECYIRHSDRCETMTMREIQDLTIQRTRGAERLDKLLDERRKSFLQWIAKSPVDKGIATGCRISLVPTSEIYVPTLFRNTTALPAPRNFEITFDRGDRMTAIVPGQFFYERPIVRGTRHSNEKLNPDFVLEAHCSGLIEILYRDISPTSKFYMSWVLGVLCNGLFMAQSFRRAADAPEVEYAYEIEIASTNTTLAIYGEDRVGRPLGAPPESPCLFPRTTLGDYRDGINQLFEIAMTDIMNSCGVTCPYKVTNVTPMSENF